MSSRLVLCMACLLPTLIAVSACVPRGEPVAGPLRVAVGIPPTAYLVERIGGRHVAVQILVRPGQDPHTFEPTPRQLQALGKAVVFFKIGLPLEDRLVEKIQHQHNRLKVVDTARGVRRRPLNDTCCNPGHDDHDHHCDDHDHGYHLPQADPHIWLSPPLLRILATNIAETLQTVDPDHAEEYCGNLGTLLREIDAVHEKIAAAMKPYRGQPFYVFHPAFGYFGNTYGLKQESIEAEGKPPTPRQLRTLIHKAKAENVRIIFVQPQFDQRSAEAVAHVLGGAVVPIDPLAKDVLENFQRIAASIGAGMN